MDKDIDFQEAFAFEESQRRGLNQVVILFVLAAMLASTELLAESVLQVVGIAAELNLSIQHYVHVWLALVIVFYGVTGPLLSAWQPRNAWQSIRYTYIRDMYPELTKQAREAAIAKFHSRTGSDHE